MRLTLLGAVFGAIAVLGGCGGGSTKATGGVSASGDTAPAQGGGVVTSAATPGSPSTTPGGGTSGGSTSGSDAPADPCADLVPTPGTPVEIVFDVSNTPFCHLPTSDGSGTAVALAIGLHHMGFEVHPMSGGASVGVIRVDHQDTGPVYDAIAPSATGFHAATGTGIESVADRGTFSAYDDHAALLTTSFQGIGTAGLVGDVRLVKPDPAGGGTALLTLSGPLNAPTFNAELVDAGGHRTAGVALDTPAADLAVALDGHVLVTAQASGDGTAWRARWLDHDAKPLTDWFTFQLTTKPPQYQVATYVLLEPLADGSIALREGDAWTLSFPNGAARTDAAPSWLVSRPGKDVAVVRGGKAVAVTGTASIAACGSGDTFELLTPSGVSCGTVQLTSASSCAHVAFGRDGTAFTLSVGASQTVGNQLCTYRWWPGLVR